MYLCICISTNGNINRAPKLGDSLPPVWWGVVCARSGIVAPRLHACFVFALYLYCICIVFVLHRFCICITFALYCSDIMAPRLPNCFVSMTINNGH